MTVAIVDYGMGNVRSVSNAVDYCGCDAEITADPQTLADASHIILPGVGAFGDAVANLRGRGLVETLEREVLERGKPFLGVCVGMQILARQGQEHGTHDGLGWLPADVVRLTPASTACKIPHMGWNEVALRGTHPVFAGLQGSALTFYFVHSFHMVCDDLDLVLGTVDHGGAVTAAVARDNIVATQFHPEKSQDNGIELFTNFLRWNP